MTFLVTDNNKKIYKNDCLRNRFVKQEKIKEFKETYTKQFDIINLNTGKYWDNIFENSGDLSTQSPMTKDKIKYISSLVPEKKLNILDLGIGDGFIEEIIMNRNCTYDLHGIDISPLSIKKMKKMFRGKFIVGDVSEINKKYPDNTMDMILAIELLEHINVSRIFSFYKKIHNILKSSGIFLLSVPINEKLDKKSTNPSAHVRDYTEEVIKKELELSGFKVLKTKKLYAFNNYYSIKTELAKIINRWEPNSLIIMAQKI